MTYFLIFLMFLYFLIRHLTNVGRAYRSGYEQASKDAQDTLDIIEDLKRNEQEQATYTMGLN